MRRFFLFGLTLLALTAWAPAQQPDLKPPVAKKVPRVFELHGEQCADDYYWMRDKKSPEVIKYLEAENAYTAAVMKPTQKLQEKLYDEFLSHIQQTDLSVPVFD